MKKQYIIGFIIGACGLVACDAWIDMKPENSITFANAFDTEKEVESALLATERRVRIEMTSASWEPQSRGEYSDYHEIGSPHLLSEENVSSYIAQWVWNYKVIASANVSLPYIDQVDMPQGRKDFYKGEIAFFKAFTYLDLIRRWGDCVLIQDNVVLTPIGKTTWPKVADYAIALAKDAVRLLPEWDELKDADGKAVTHRARPCKGSANALLAHLCAWKAGCKYMALPEDRDYSERELWEVAEKACTAIIGRKDIYDLEADPDAVCNKTLVDGGKECVYESVCRGYWNEFDDMSKGNAMTLGFAYESYPVRPDHMEGDITQMPCRILNSTVQDMFEYPGPDESVIDLRRDAWFYDFEGMKEMDEEITGGYTYPYKFRPVMVATEGWEAGEFINFDCNKIWWRLADIILLRAECRVRLGDEPGAIEDLNAIRDRAQAIPYAASEYGGDLRYAIYKEREKELLMEGSRYIDILRNGYYKTELYGGFRNVSDQDIVDGVFFNALEGYVFKDNPLMRQNSYWLKRM